MIVDVVQSFNCDCELPHIASLLQRWALHCDRGEKTKPTKMQHGEENLNDMHAAGLGIAKLLWHGQFAECCVDLQAATGGQQSTVAFSTSPVQKMSFNVLQSSVAAFQLSFHRQYLFRQSGVELGADTLVVVLAFLSRLGFFLSHDFAQPPGVDWEVHTDKGKDDAWSAPSADGGVVAEAKLEQAKAPRPNVAAPASLPSGENSGAHLVGDSGDEELPVSAADVWTTGRMCLRVATACRILDALHAVLSLHLLLSKAAVAPPWQKPASQLEGGDMMLDGSTASQQCDSASAVALQPYHREAGMDTYNELILYANCPVGTIAQYMHRFNHLFHSVSQVVYYNYPDFRRPPQKSFEALDTPNAPAINLLPVLLELEPLPVLYEHTGAGHAATHAKHPRAWVVWDRFVLQVDSAMNVRYAEDLRALSGD